MGYLVNRVTKEHDQFGPEWIVVEADSEGWIKHEGNACPLPDDVDCEIRLADGMEVHQKDYKMYTPRCWEKWNYSSDITHYRPILEPEKVQEPEPTHAPDYDPRSVSFNLLKRLQAAHEAAQTIPDLEAKLREVLAGMGYDLVARSPFVEPEAAVETEQDMSDWRNWREGDLVECVEGTVGCVSRGDLYKVEAAYPSDPHYVGICPDDNGVLGAYRPNRFRFHSRPAKGE